MTSSRGVARATLLLLLAVFGRTEACTTAAWSATVGGATAVEPFDQAGATRYSGHCALAGVPGTTAYVVDNSPSENTYRAHFYVYLGTTDGSPKLFSATSADNLAGSELLSIRYNAPMEQVEFSAAGQTSTIPMEPGHWVAMEVFYQSGSTLQAWLTYRGTELTVSGPVSLPAGPIESVALGVVASSAGTGALYFDEFDSTRDSGSRVGALCRGDANPDGTIGTGDADLIADERVQRVLASGQPDCNEDGVVNVFDVACVHRRRIDGDGCSLFGKSWLKLLLGIFADGFE